MKIKFWGSRGSIPTPGPNTVKYGGNTSCVQVDTGNGDLIIIDAGSGIRELGQQLMATEFGKGQGKGHLFLTHTHWDHIQGFPFFVPTFIPGNSFTIYGANRIDTKLDEILSGQMVYPYFPVPIEVMGSDLRFREIQEGSFELEDIQITACRLNHPGGALGYRIEHGGKIFTYSSDTEHLANGGFDSKVLELSKDSDLVIYDSQYTPEEYETKVGWGHSTGQKGAELAQEAGAKRLAMYHHDPSHTDDKMDEILDRCRKEAKEKGIKNIEILAASEGLEIEL